MDRKIVNKRGIVAMLLFIMAAILFIIFGVILWNDYAVHYPYGSAPFYVYVLERVIEILLPAGLCVTFGMLIKKKRGSGMLI